MARNGITQLSQLVDTSTHNALMEEVRRIFSYHYPDRYFRRVNRTYNLVKKLYSGGIRGYKACTTDYHDLSHVLDILLTVIRLIDGHNSENPPFPVQLVVTLLEATLLHDTGYLQEEGDDEGTGAKYTMFHVERGVQFLRNTYEMFEIAADDVKLMVELIRCTSYMVKIEDLTFSSPEERLAGCILGTADLLGQISDRTYLEKLIFLYYEFKEAGIKGFNTEFDLIRKTIDFYETTKKRFTDTYVNVYRYAQHHFRRRFDIDRNLYMEAIDRHIEYLRKIIEDDTTNFRHKLKRGKWVHTYPRTKPG
jgi:hypothetical protein